jgi:hypothetical protein
LRRSVVVIWVHARIRSPERTTWRRRKRS